MSAKPRKNILDQLPPELKFLAPCVREMRKLRVGYRPSADPVECPEAARDEEIERFFDDDTRILGQHLRDSLPASSRDEFCGRAVVVQSALFEWLTAYRSRFDEPEVAILFGIVGFLSNPVPFYKRPEKKKKK